MNNKIEIGDNANCSLHSCGRTSPCHNQAGEKTSERVSVVPPEQVSPLLALPDELLVKIADYLSFVDWRSLDLTSRRLNTLFNTEERLKILFVRYYGSPSEAYRKIIENRGIPAVPHNEIKNPFLRLACGRYLSNNYLASLGNDASQTCVKTLSGHTGEVMSVTPLAGGRLASCAADETVRVWDLSKPDGSQCVMTLNGHTGIVHSVTELPDGRLASCSADETVNLWDLSKPDGQQCVATLRGHSYHVRSVIPLADGRLASCATDGTVKVWDLSKPDGQQCVATLRGHTKGVSSVTQLPDGRLASCAGDHTVKVWDLSKPDGQQCVATLNGHTQWVESVTAFDDGRLASCSLDKTVKVWDLSKPDGQQCVATLNGHTSWVRFVTVLADGRLASCAGDYHEVLSGDGSGDKSIKVWDLSMPDGQQCVATLNGHESWVNSVTQLPNGLLVSCSDDMDVKVWDLKAGAMRVDAQGHTDGVSSVTAIAGQLDSFSL
ncbi:F-box/WD40 repeat-containing protein [Endozoicomonas sp. GU-1]|uniref:F-box/WD repeat-containing protein n=1 Tax=Endozoicomonas sp. GU-1 TaxID=3009078 RepID=UPI0022B2E664|nr:F-box/WD40 repeat-containing protein [Endozoicomonas sp. GU-1]WBA80140.1 F-box/WD40 repeat-containing protein [Endozoicomonas sp. GU-1]WBA87714.1 F-box/WD40 repeat-containing protein [Endozoicomonas sp. GU-1]